MVAAPARLGGKDCRDDRPILLGCQMSEETVVEVSSDLGANAPEPTPNEAAQKPEESAARKSSTMNRRMLPQRPASTKAGFRNASTS